MKKKQRRSLLTISLFLLPLTLLFTACDVNATGGGTITVGTGATGTVTTTSAVGAPATAAGIAITMIAQALQNNLFGVDANIYDAASQIWRPVVNYWMNGQGCHNGNAICQVAASGTLQCVEFVTGTYGAAGDPLPAIGNGNQFWGLYANRAGWQEIPNGQMPFRGDIAAWSGGQYGHVAIVVDAQAPQGTQNGFVRVAQANAPGTTYPGSASPGNYYTMTWTPSGVVTWPGWRLEGYIHQLNGQASIPLELSQAALLAAAQAHNLPRTGAPPALFSGARLFTPPVLTATQQQWATLAMQSAEHFQLIPVSFVRQINQESGFQPKVVSKAGATGIAQFLPSTAAGIPRCVINLSNPPNCATDPTSVPSGKGIDPNNPTEALPAAAYYMAQLFAHYLTLSTGFAMQNRLTAYAQALAAYNAGGGAVDGALQRCGANWLGCIDQQQSNNGKIDYHETRDYVEIIMGCNVVQASGATCNSQIN